MITEFAYGSEHCTAVMTSPLLSGEEFDGPISTGVYPGQSEVWLEFKNTRVNIQARHIDEFCKQLKRAKRVAAELLKEI